MATTKKSPRPKNPARRQAGAKPTSVAEYFAALPPATRKVLESLRRMIQAEAKDAELVLSYGIVAFQQDRMLVGIGATANHCALYLMDATTLADHHDLVDGLDVSAGTIRFAATSPLPKRLVQTLVRARLAANAASPKSPRKRR